MDKIKKWIHKVRNKHIVGYTEGVGTFALCITRINLRTNSYWYKPDWPEATWYRINHLSTFNDLAGIKDKREIWPILFKDHNKEETSVNV